MHVTIKTTPLLHSYTQRRQLPELHIQQHMGCQEDAGMCMWLPCYWVGCVCVFYNLIDVHVQIYTNTYPRACAHTFTTYLIYFLHTHNPYSLTPIHIQIRLLTDHVPYWWWSSHHRTGERGPVSQVHCEHRGIHPLLRVSMVYNNLCVENGVWCMSYGVCCMS